MDREPEVREPGDPRAQFKNINFSQTKAGAYTACSHCGGTTEFGWRHFATHCPSKTLIYHSNPNCPCLANTTKLVALRKLPH